jgi:hypothetical protein
MRVGRDGYAAALAMRDMAGIAAVAAARYRNFRRGSFMIAPSARLVLQIAPVEA